MTLVGGTPWKHAHLDVFLGEQRGWAWPPQELAELFNVGGAPIQGLPLERPHIETSVHLSGREESVRPCPNHTPFPSHAFWFQQLTDVTT